MITNAGYGAQRTPCSVVSGPLRRLLGQAPCRSSCPLRDFAASGPQTGAWVICPPCQARYTGLPPPAPVLSGGSRRPAVSPPGHAHGSTSRAPRHHPCTYIMKRDPYPRRPKLCSASPVLRGQGRGEGRHTLQPRAEPVEARLGVLSVLRRSSGRHAQNERSHSNVIPAPLVRCTHERESAGIQVTSQPGALKI